MKNCLTLLEADRTPANFLSFLPSQEVNGHAQPHPRPLRSPVVTSMDADAVAPRFSADQRRLLQEHLLALHTALRDESFEQSEFRSVEFRPVRRLVADIHRFITTRSAAASGGSPVAPRQEGKKGRPRKKVNAKWSQRTFVPNAQGADDGGPRGDRVSTVDRPETVRREAGPDSRKEEDRRAIDACGLVAGRNRMREAARVRIKEALSIVPPVGALQDCSSGARLGRGDEDDGVAAASSSSSNKGHSSNVVVKVVRDHSYGGRVEEDERPLKVRKVVPQDFEQTRTVEEELDRLTDLVLPPPDGAVNVPEDVEEDSGYDGRVVPESSSTSSFSKRKNVFPRRFLNEAQACYVCMGKYTELHHFYHRLCPACAVLNWKKRFQTADLSLKPKTKQPYICLVTGGRSKIGFRTAVKLLDAGAVVLVTTRFVQNCKERFEKHYTSSTTLRREDVEQEELFSHSPAGVEQQAVLREAGTEKPHRRSADGALSRLKIFGVDFRFLPQVERFCQHLLNDPDVPCLDVLVHNAAQTIRRSEAHWQPLFEQDMRAARPALGDDDEEEEGRKIPIMNFVDHNQICAMAEREQRMWHSLGGTRSPWCAAPSSEEAAFLGTTATTRKNKKTPFLTAQSDTTPDGTGGSQACDQEDHRRGGERAVAALRRLTADQVNLPDAQGDRIDLENWDSNSWTALLEHTSSQELAETFCVNAMAPFILNARLKPMMVSDEKVFRFIVHVSSMEGDFSRAHKSERHCHTNMAKAALNMMTRTAAGEFVGENICLTAVDTGWVTNENPLRKAQNIWEKRGFQPPLDEIDAASRVLDPVFGFLNGEVEAKRPLSGVFVKDYKEVSW